MGELTPIDNSFEQTTMPAENNKKVSVVKVNFKLHELLKKRYITTLLTINKYLEIH